ncbi:MAG TPA: flagellar hook-associated protein FlgL, partial [Geobacteraceae bacterium]|nr:flagellar hook-associated protein FlgL [Geobacteraceae bacterium]
MRITDSMRFNTMVNNLNNTQSDYNEISEQIATQKKVNRASDDPAAATRILDIQRGKAAIEQYKQNMDISRSWISATETTLSSASDMLNTAMGIALGSAGADAATRENAAANIQDIIDSMRSLANTKWGDRYLFSGTREDVAPFTVAPSDATIDPPQAAAGNTFAGTVVSSGAYTGDTNKTYAVKITTAGALGAATYKFSTDGGRTWNTNAPAPDLITPSNGVISLGDSVTLTFDDVLGTNPFGENDVFYVNATA